jgi:hypothetical protein
MCAEVLLEHQFDASNTSVMHTVQHSGKVC